MSQSPQFFLSRTFVCHTKAINVLKLSSDGLRLLSGGDDSKVIVWNLWGALPSPEWVAHFPQHGAICSGTWAPVKHERSLQRIIFGCVDGSIHVYRCTSPGDFSFVCKIYPHSDAVQDLAFDTNYNRLASVGGGQLIVWSIGPQDELVQMAITSPRDSIARSARFLEGGTVVLVAFLQSHEVHVYQIKPWKMKGSYVLPTRIGYAAIGEEQRTLLITNLATGVDLYDFPPSKPIRVFRHIIRKNVPLAVIPAMGDTLAIVGSDDGCVRIFDQRTGSLMSTLPHGPIGSLVQVVDAYSSRGECVIASGTSDEKESIFEIKLWTTNDPAAQIQEIPFVLQFIHHVWSSRWYLIGCFLALFIQYTFLRILGR